MQQPTSTAYTRRAPRASNRSVKPPVEAPTSRATAPVGSMAHWSSARCSLSAPRLTYSGPPEITSTAASSETLSAGRVATTPPTRTRPPRISDCARSRVSASPRLTRTRSSRLRDVLVEILAQLVPQLRLAHFAQRGGLGRPNTLPGSAELTGRLARSLVAPAGEDSSQP